MATLPLIHLTPFQFVDGRSFASNGAFNWDIPPVVPNTGLAQGIASVGQSLAEGITLGVKMREQRRENEADRALQEKRIDASIQSDILRNTPTPLDALQLEGASLENELRRKKLSEAPASDSWLSENAAPEGDLPTADPDGLISPLSGVPETPVLERKSPGPLVVTPPTLPAVQAAPANAASNSPARVPIGGGMFAEEKILPDGSKVSQIVDDRRGGKRIGSISRAAAPKPPLPEGRLSKEQLQALNQIRDDFRQDPYVKKAYDAMAEIGSFKAAIGQNNSAGDIAAINAFQRMVDPGVAVREGDVTLLQSALPKYQRVWLDAQNVLSSAGKLTPELRAQFSTIADELYKTRVANANERTLPRFKKVATAAGIPFDLVGEEFSPEAPGAPNSGGIPQVTSREQYEALPAGSIYLDAEGKKRKKAP